MGVHISKRKQFIIILSAFFVLGAAFKVMVLIEGFTEVRPVNAIPPVAGLVSGPVGALACGIGNLLADMLGSFNLSSILGVIANFIAAYLPYRLWHLFSKETPNLHKAKNIFLYTVISLTTALTVAWILSFGLFILFGTWIEVLYTYVFFNNFGFSLVLGMPVLIILTSDSFQVECEKRPKKYRILKTERLKILLCACYLVFMLIIFAAVFIFHLNPGEEIWLLVLSVFVAAGLVCQLI